MNYVVSFLICLSIVLFMSYQKPHKTKLFFTDLVDVAFALLVAWLLQ